MTAYFPAPGDAWEKIEPQSAGLDPSRLDEAVAFAIEAESPMNRNIQEALDEGHFSEPPPLGDIIGPTRDRGDPHGLVIKGGRIVAEWGDPSSVDMTFSAAKSYLSICAGLAHDEGLIPDDAEVVAHATAEAVKGRRVWGVLPHSLSCLTASFSEVPLDLPAELRGKELSAAQVAAHAGVPVTYKVAAVKGAFPEVKR